MGAAKFHVPVEVAGPAGATAATRYAGATVSGAPVTGTFLKGDFVCSHDGNVYVCTVAGTPGTWSSGAAGVTYGTPALTLGTANAAGSIDEAIRRDATILAFDATAPSTQAFGDAAAAGAAAVAARRDHKHAMPAAPTSVSGNAGTATALQTPRAIDGQAFDGTADITVIAPGTHAATSMVTPVDNDELALVDSAASNVLKRLLWSNLKATLKTYFDTLYASTTGAAPIGTSELIYRYTVTGSDKASIDTGVDTADAGTGTWSGGDLLEIYMLLRTDEAALASTVNVTVNNDSSALYDLQRVTGINATASAGNALAGTSWQLAVDGASEAASFFTAVCLTIPFYANTVAFKRGAGHFAKGDSTNTNDAISVLSVAWRSSSAITRLKIIPNTAAKKLLVGSSIAIYRRRST